MFLATWRGIPSSLIPCQQDGGQSSAKQLQQQHNNETKVTCTSWVACTKESQCNEPKHVLIATLGLKLVTGQMTANETPGPQHIFKVTCSPARTLKNGGILRKARGVGDFSAPTWQTAMANGSRKEKA